MISENSSQLHSQNENHIFADDKKKIGQDLIELFVSGFVEAGGPNRSILILQDEKQEHLFPVWLAAHEERIVKDQVEMKPSASNAFLTQQKVFADLGVKFQDCIFTGISAGVQKVTLTYEKNKKKSSVYLKAEESMSFCIAQKMRFWSSIELIQECQNQQLEVEQNAAQSFYEEGLSENNQKYLF